MKKPKILGFKADGMFEEVKEKRLRKEKDYLLSFEFFLISIATKSKGPMYTIRKPKDLRWDIAPVDYSVYITSYGFTEGPYVTHVEFDTIFKASSFMPTIIQSLMNVAFIDNNFDYGRMYPEIDDPVATRYEWTDGIHKGSLDLDDLDDPERSIRRAPFKEFGLRTSTDKVMEEANASVIFLKGNEYYFFRNRTREDNDTAYLSQMQMHQYEAMIYVLRPYETAYIVTYAELYRLNQIHAIEVYFRDIDIDSQTFMELEDSVSFHDTANGIMGYFELIICSVDLYRNGWLYFNNLEHYHVGVSIVIYLETCTDPGCIDLTEEESKEFPFYPIIDKLICSK